MADYAPHQQRVFEEKAELDARLEKLTGFLHSPQADAINSHEIAWMTIQESIMRAYSRCLANRIALWTQQS